MDNKLTMNSTNSIKTAYFSKQSGNFDHLKTSVVTYLTLFEWNWPDLKKIITDLLSSSLNVFVNLPFLAKTDTFWWNWRVFVELWSLFSEFRSKSSLILSVKARVLGQFFVKFSHFQLMKQLPVSFLDQKNLKMPLSVRQCHVKLTTKKKEEDVYR